VAGLPRLAHCPLAYVAYTLARGAVTNWYPYPFLDVTQLGHLTVLWHVVVLLRGFFGLRLLIIGIDRLARLRVVRAAAVFPPRTAAEPRHVLAKYDCVQTVFASVDHQTRKKPAERDTSKVDAAHAGTSRAFRA
jgi:hypothetical protein